MNFRRCIFFIVFAFFIVLPFTNRAQVISATIDTADLTGIRLAEMVDYIKGHSFSMEDYLKKKGFNKIDDNKESYFQNESSRSWVYLDVKENYNLLPKSIADLKQEYIIIKSLNSSFKSTIEKIIYDLKTDDNFSADINSGKGEFSFYSIKKDFYIKIFSTGEYDLIAVY